MKEGRWTTITPSQFQHEREALDHIRGLLPDSEPYRAWSNFTFTADTGHVREVDLLEAFDPAIRDGLAEFFQRALHRDGKQRFESLKDMRDGGVGRGRACAVPCGASLQGLGVEQAR